MKKTKEGKQMRRIFFIYSMVAKEVDGGNKAMKWISMSLYTDTCT